MNNVMKRKKKKYINCQNYITFGVKKSVLDALRKILQLPN